MNTEDMINSMVAERIMGWKKVTIAPELRKQDFPIDWMWDKREGDYYWNAQRPLLYSEDLEHAMMVVNRLYSWNKMLHFNMLRTHDWAQGEGTKWGASFFAYMGMGEHEEFGKCIDESLPMAICKAALIAVLHIEKKYGKSFVEMMGSSE